MSSIEENLLELENSKEDLEVIQIIDECFKDDPLLKFEVFKEGVSFTYSELSNSMGHIYVSPIKEEKKFLISQMYPYWYSKRLRPYEKITRMLVSNNGRSNVVNIYRDRVVESGEIDPETEKPILIPKISKVPQYERVANDILPRTEMYLNMLLELKKLSPRYNSSMRYFRGNISQCGDCDKFIPIWEGLKDLRKKGFIIKNADFKNVNQFELPRYNHLPYIVFDN